MSTPIRVLFIENNAADARLLSEQLRAAGFAPQWNQVETEAGYVAAIAQPYDLILADYALPAFDVLRALALLNEKKIDVPLIVVSGTVGEDKVIDAMRAGASECLSKDQLARLGDAVRRALTQRELRAERKRQADRFAAFQQRTRAILDTANDPYVEMDADGRIIDWNVQAESVFGWSRREVVGRRIVDTIVPAKYRDAHERGRRRYLQTGEEAILNRRIETTARRRDGSELPVEVVVWPIHVAGTVTFSAFVRDMTQRKQVEETLVERARLAALSAEVGLSLIQGHSLADMLNHCAQAMVNHLDAAFARIWTLNADGHMLELQASAGMYTHLDGRHSRVPVGHLKIGSIAEQRLPHLTNDVINDPRVSDPAWARQEGIVSFAGYPLLVEDRLVGVIGMFARRPLTAATLDALGAIANHVALGVEHKRAEDSLLESNERLQSLIQASPLAIVAVNRDQRVLMWNPAAEHIFGWTAAEVLGQPVPFLPPESPAEPTRRMADEFAGHSWAAADSRRVRKDGTTVDVSLWTAPLRDARGQVVAAMGIHADMTQHRRLEAQFRQAQKMEAVGRLAGGVAHDFNNLLTIILGYTDLLRATLHEHDIPAEPVDVIDDAARRAAALTRQLLAFSRKQVIQPTQVEVNAVVGGMENMLRRLLGEDVLLVTKLSPNLSEIRADVAQLEQVIMNLAVNARDAMSSPGTLTIETSQIHFDAEVAAEHNELREGDFVVLAVSDTGHGMDATTKTHVFEPFFTTKEPGQGTGLGLATIYGIVQQSGGFVTVYSEPGLGATFRVYLPCATSATGPPAAKEIAPLAQAGTETVLLVEDEQGVRQLAAIMLRRLGYSVVEAASADQAIEWCQRHDKSIDLVLTDVVMPHMSGRQLVDRLQSMRPSIRALFMSGYTDDAVIRNGVLDHGQAYLQKPFTPQALSTAVRDVLDRRAAAPSLGPLPINVPVAIQP